MQQSFVLLSSHKYMTELIQTNIAAIDETIDSMHKGKFQ